jgi:aldose sugar dehydrogenase
MIRWINARLIQPVAASLLVVCFFSAVPLMAASINAGHDKPDAKLPFVAMPVATFDTPWAIAFLPDGRLLVTEKPGHMFIVTQAGEKTEITNVPEVEFKGQLGLLDVAASPGFATDHTLYLTYAEPGKRGSSLALATATLKDAKGAANLENMKVIWRQEPKGSGGQPGGIIAFAPDGKTLFLTSGDRMRPETAQDPDQALGKILHLNLDGTAAADNPFAAKGEVQAQIWTSGHRNPYGLAFAPDGKLWEHEMGPQGGDELNLILPGRNYGWPIVSNGDNYDGSVIPDHDTRPEFEAPKLYWTPIIAPAGLAFYNADLFKDWKGSALIGALGGSSLVRIAFDDKGGAQQANRWDLEARIRDVAVGPDGAVWIIEDDSEGRLLKLTPRP